MRQNHDGGAATTTAESEFDRGVHESDWPLAVRSLDAIAADQRGSHLTTTTTAQLLRLAQAAEQLGLMDVRNLLSAKLQEPAHAGAAAAIMRDDEFNAAWAAKDWNRIVTALAAYDDVGIQAKLAPMSLDELTRIKEAAERLSNARVLGPAETNRVRKLGEDWRDAVRLGLWEKAVTLVQSYNDIDLPIRLRDDLDLDKISALCGQADKMPSFQRVRRAAEPIRIAKLNDEYAAAVNAAAWPRAVTLLNAYNDDDLLPKTRMIEAKGGTALADAGAVAAAQWPDLHQRVRRAFTYLGMAATAGPGHTGTRRPTQTRNTTSAYSAHAGGGDVTVTLDDTLTPASGAPVDQWYSISYTGAEAEKTGWMQFIHRDIEKFDAGGTSLGFITGSIPISGQPAMQLDPDNTHPVWIIDSLSNSSPFYESAAAATTAPTETTMHDMPGAMRSKANAAFADSAVKKVVSRAHFDTYLVRDMRVLHHVRVNVEWSFTGAAAADPRRVQTVGGGGAANALPPELRAALLVRFPTYTYIP